MRPNDKSAFADVAKQLGLWILVRATNEKSCDYVGNLNYIGKPMDVKAKTADNDVGKYKVGGLVANPHLAELRGAFEAAKLGRAMELWDKLMKERPGLEKGPSGPYDLIRDKNQMHFGCLTRDGKCVHGDYDLYDIIDPGRPTGNLGLVRTIPPVAGSTAEPIDTTPHHWTKVSLLINARIGKPMINHGGDYQWIAGRNEHVAGHLDDKILAFGPGRELIELDGTRAVAAFYGNRFPNRKSMRQRY